MSNVFADFTDGGDVTPAGQTLSREERIRLAAQLRFDPEVVDAAKQMDRLSLEVTAQVERVARRLMAAGMSAVDAFHDAGTGFVLRFAQVTALASIKAAREAVHDPQGSKPEE